MEEAFQKIVKNLIKEYESLSTDIKTIRSSISIFDKFIKEILTHHNKPANNLSDLNHKLRRNPCKGPLFEIFCKNYFKEICGVEEIWLLKECPQDIMEKLSLTRKDYGIDLVMRGSDGRYSPIQCKLKSPKKLSKNKEQKYHYLNVTWRELSTFYALCDRTGPTESWEKYIVFTNTNYVNRKGRKSEKDKSVCYCKLSKLTVEDFKKLIHSSDEDFVERKEDKLPYEDIIEKRMNYFANMNTSNNIKNINNINLSK
jgi:predicted helicase